MPTTSYTGYSLYTYTGTGAPKGMVGRVTDDGTTITPVPNLMLLPGVGDPQIEGFTDGSNLRLAVTPYTGSGQTATIYDMVSASTVTGSPFLWTSVSNAYGIEKIGSNFFVIDFDNARIVRLNSSYNQASPPPANSWSFTGVPALNALIPSGYAVHGQAILNIGGTLYGLFTITDSSWTNYANSVLVKFTINAITGAISVGANDYNSNIGKNAFTMTVQGSDLYIACLGGRQNGGSPNTNSAVDKIAYGASPLTGATVTQPVTYSSVGNYEIRDITFKGTTAFVLVGNYNASYNMQGKLIYTTISAGTWSGYTTLDNFTASPGVAGYRWGAQYIDHDRILYARGNEIWYYTAASLGTTPTKLTLAGGSLQPTGQNYTNLNDISYVGTNTTVRVRGYSSPVQVSQTPRGVAARAIAQGRPELTTEELLQLEEELEQKESDLQSTES